MHEVIHTTPTQYAFGCCVLVLAPALGLIGAVVERDRGGSAALGAISVVGAGWAGWILSGSVAVALFPRYPREPIPETLAMLFVLPGLVSAGSVLAFRATRRARTLGTVERERRVAATTLSVAFAIGIALVAGHRWLTRSPALRSLPAGAQLLHERRVTYDDFLGDYHYSVTARMTREEFATWMVSVGLPRITDDEYGTDEHGDCGARGTFVDGVGSYESWCS